MRRGRTRQPTFLIRCARFAVTTSAALIVSATAIGQTKNYPLNSSDGLRLHNVTAEPVVLQGKKGLRITISDEAQRRLNALPPQDQGRLPQLAIVEGIRFGDGVIEAEIAGARMRARPRADLSASTFVSRTS
jgi:hypothetical protein